MINYNITKESINAVIDGKMRSVKAGAPNFLQFRQALLEERWDDAKKHATVGIALNSWAKGRFSVEGNHVRMDGKDLPADINTRVLEMAAKGEDPTYLLAFWERLKLNPSWRSVEQLFRFLSNAGIPITKDGHFLAYKGVRTDMKDVHSGTISNHIGAKPSVPRNEVSDDPNTACHFGLHVGALSYAQGFGPTVVICKVDPANVVCVPFDSSSQKMRVSEYEVVGYHGAEMPSTTIKDEEFGHGSVDVDLEEEGPPEPPPAAPSNQGSRLRAGAKKWARFDRMTRQEMELENLDEIRRYAAKGLRLVGIYRLSKADLLTKIVGA